MNEKIISEWMRLTEAEKECVLSKLNRSQSYEDENDKHCDDENSCHIVLAKPVGAN